MSVISEIDRIRKLGIYRGFTNEVLLSYLKLVLYNAIPRIENRKNGTKNLIGFKVSYFDLMTLKFLFRDIYVEADYYFEAENDTPFIIDCGSNIGLSILFFKKLYPKAEVIGFEPDKNTFEILSENIRQNDLNNVKVHQKALLDEKKTVPFYYRNDYKGYPAMSLDSSRMSNYQFQEVQADLLSDYITKDVDFLKLDVEGAEIAVLNDLHKNNKLRKIKQMVIEYHHHLKPHDDKCSQALKILEDNNFSYQIKFRGKAPFKKDQFQDIMIFAYQR